MQIRKIFLRVNILEELLEGVGCVFFKISWLLLVRFGQSRAHFKAEKLIYVKIAKISCRQIASVIF